MGTYVTILVGGISSTLPGLLQRPTRACTDAFAYLLQHSIGPVRVAPDASYLVDGVGLYTRHLSPSGTHVELWSSIGHHAQHRHIIMGKATAHISVKAFLTDPTIDAFTFAGNHYADNLAATGVTAAQCDLNNIIASVLHNMSYALTQRQHIFKNSQAQLSIRLPSRRAQDTALR